MTEVVKSENCGNSPKNLFVQDLAIAFARRDIDFLLDGVSDDIRWKIIGDQEIQGKDAFTELINDQKRNRVTQITVQSVITHGKAGAVNGIRQLENGRVEEFCDVYEFTNARGTGVAVISSYVIETKS